MATESERMLVCFGYAGPSIVAVSGPYLEAQMEFSHEFDDLQINTPSVEVGMRVWEGGVFHHCDSSDEDCDCDPEFGGEWRLPTSEELQDVAAGRNPWATKENV
jgi:hypothetical protein